MRALILDCYTDEPAGLGVPPYLGTYPRYLYGYLKGEGYEVEYINIDDLRLHKLYDGVKREPTEKQKTNIRVYNTTGADTRRLLSECDVMYVIIGVHVPGKYLSAIPGTLNEVAKLLASETIKKVLTGPAVFGTQLEGGKFFEKSDTSSFDEILDMNWSYDNISKFSVSGAGLLSGLDGLHILEIETGRGCSRKVGCSFCTETIKSPLMFRNVEHVLSEVSELYRNGARYFRIGKQSCFYSYPDGTELLKKIRETCPDIKVLHIDNVNPANVVKDEKNGAPITKAIVEYCTEGNVAAFGVESFDSAVVAANNLNSSPDVTYLAVKILNKYGSERGPNGMPKFLPGINILFGLKGESRATHDENMKWLSKMLDDGLLVRRINIRQVSIFEGTRLFEECGNKFIKKNKKFYWRWRNDIRQHIDNEMLKRICPVGHVLHDYRAEVYDGKTTFGRQVGTYPLIVGVKQRLAIGESYSVRIIGHMLRSLVGEVDR